MVAKWEPAVWCRAVVLLLTHCLVGSAQYTTAMFTTSVTLPIEDINCYHLPGDLDWNTVACAVQCQSQQPYCYGMRWREADCIICVMSHINPPVDAIPKPPPTDIIYRHGKIAQTMEQTDQKVYQVFFFEVLCPVLCAPY